MILPCTPNFINGEMGQNKHTDEKNIILMDW